MEPINQYYGSPYFNWVHGNNLEGKNRKVKKREVEKFEFFGEETSSNDWTKDKKK